MMFAMKRWLAFAAAIGAPVTLRYAATFDFAPGVCCSTSCGSNTPLQNLTATASHEVAEAVTDPQPLTAPAGLFSRTDRRELARTLTLTCSDFSFRLLYRLDEDKGVRSGHSPITPSPHHRPPIWTSHERPTLST